MRAGRRLGVAVSAGIALLIGFGDALPARQAEPAVPGPPVAAQYVPPVAPPAAPLVADAGDPATVALGEKLYLGHCASCHGHYRQGQPLWQIIDAYAGRRAPALDDTGDIWRRSDAALFHMTKYGRFAAAPRGAVSFMPAFGSVLADNQILAIIAFIKARWPIGLRIAQAMLNPGFAGMPVGVDDPAWRLPPSCNALHHRAAVAQPSQ
jgi:S-disulfanyl-L-cysteine oxidoreductase SoxD